MPHALNEFFLPNLQKRRAKKITLLEVLKFYHISPQFVKGVKMRKFPLLKAFFQHIFTKKFAKARADSKTRLLKG